MESYYAINTSQSLYHHGVKGMRWGRRRYQNEDGSLTPLGRAHYRNEAYDGLYKVKEGTTLYKQKKSAERKLTTAVTAGSAAINAAMGSPYVANAIAVSKAALATGNPVIIGSAAVGAVIGGIAAYKINQYTVSKPVLAAVDAAKRHLAAKKLVPNDKQIRKAIYDNTKLTRKRDKILSKAGYVQNEEGDVYTHKKTGTRLYSDSIMDGGFSDKDVKKAVKAVNRADARIKHKIPKK